MNWRSVVGSRIVNVTALSFFCSIFLLFIMPVWDVDFPWHLKTGEYIAQHHEIPKADPFTYASNGSIVEKFILSNYWLAQVFFYFIFLKTGPLGIIIMRASLLTAIIIILWRSMKDAPLVLKTVLLYFTAVLFLMYSGERPQLFSFLFSLVTIALLEKYRKNNSVKSLFFVPLVMLLWSNTHGGFIFGDFLIVVVCVSETIKYFFLKKYTASLTQRHMLMLLGAGLISIVISGLNPNGYYALTFAIDSGSQNHMIIREYISPFAETQGSLANRNNFIYWAVVGYCLILLALNLRRIDLTHLALVLSTLGVSLTAVRYVPFFIMTGLFISGDYRFGIGDFRGLAVLKKAVPALNIALLAVVVVFCGYRIHLLPDKLSLSAMGESTLHCEKAAVFIKDEIREGKIFNSPSTGGYLILSLFPQFKVFTDTRAYNPQNLIETEAVSAASRWEGDRAGIWETFTGLLPKTYGTLVVKTGAKPGNPRQKELWAEILDRHKIDIIVHEACSLVSGDLYHLPLRLIACDQWKLVYLDGRVLIYVRNVPKYRELIAKYQLDKNNVYDEIGMESMNGLNTSHSSFYSNIAFALMMKGGPDASVQEFIDHALYLNPKDVMASSLTALMQIKARATSNPSR
ncbi:MAG: hypothetical protein HZB33_05465 [Nitrospirae bacterium]|nr:hypothetical protein [Nitrospirota bacterium]